VGGDAAVIRLEDKYLVLKSDPITGAVENIGWLAVNIPSNDVAVVGAKPQWILPVLIMPTSESGVEVENIMRQIDEAAKDLNIAIVGGHTEFISGIDHPIVCSFVAAVTKERILSSADAKPGDLIVLTGGAAIEATAILASDLQDEVEGVFGSRFVERAKSFIKRVSVVKGALEAAKIDGVTAMHDPTEGGIYTALHEMAEASSTGLLVFKDRIFMADETRKLCDFYGLDPLGSISSGALLIAVKPTHETPLLSRLKDVGLKVDVIGEFREADFGRKIVDKDGKITDLPLPTTDELWILYEKITKKKRND